MKEETKDVLFALAALIVTMWIFIIGLIAIGMAAVYITSNTCI